MSFSSSPTSIIVEAPAVSIFVWTRQSSGTFWWASVWRCGLSVENSGAPLERCKFLVHFNDGYIEESDHEGGVGEKAQ